MTKGIYEKGKWNINLSGLRYLTPSLTLNKLRGEQGRGGGGVIVNLI